MKFTSIFLIVLIVLSCAISSFATPQCEDCKNALKTADGKLPAKRTRQVVENFLQQNCQTATGLVPIEVPVPLPVKLCDAMAAHKSDFVNGLIERKEYTLVCKKAGLC